jgi:hypothetical protein
MSEQIPKAVELADVIDGVMGSLGNEIAVELRRLAAVEVERDALRTQCETLSLRIGTEQMRLTACGVVAMADTPESASLAREMAPAYWSDSCADVARRVDECIALRAELAAAKAQVEAMTKYAKPIYLIATGEVHEGSETYTRHDAPVPLADQEVLFTRPCLPLSGESETQSILSLTDEPQMPTEISEHAAFKSYRTDQAKLLVNELQAENCPPGWTLAAWSDKAGLELIRLTAAVKRLEAVNDLYASKLRHAQTNATHPLTRPAVPEVYSEPQDIGGHKFRAAYVAAEKYMREVTQDAARYRLLTADHASREVRRRVGDIAEGITIRGKGATDAAIDAMLAAAPQPD